MHLASDVAPHSALSDVAPPFPQGWPRFFDRQTTATPAPLLLDLQTTDGMVERIDLPVERTLEMPRGAPSRLVARALSWVSGGHQPNDPLRCTLGVTSYRVEVEVYEAGKPSPSKTETLEGTVEVMQGPPL